jgi:hypothetical protein
MAYADGRPELPVKTQLMIAREQAMLVEIEKERGRRRMALGSDGGPSKSTDRVAQAFKRTSGKTVQRRLKILKVAPANMRARLRNPTGILWRNHACRSAIPSHCDCWQ